MKRSRFALPFERNEFRAAVESTAQQAIASACPNRQVPWIEQEDLTLMLDAVTEAIFDRLVQCGRGRVVGRTVGLDFDGYASYLLFQLYWWRRTDKVYICIECRLLPVSHQCRYVWAKKIGVYMVESFCRWKERQYAMRNCVPDRYERYLLVRHQRLRRQLQHLKLPEEDKLIYSICWIRPCCALLRMRHHLEYVFATVDKYYLTARRRFADLSAIATAMQDDAYLLPAYLQAENQNQLRQLIALRNQYSGGADTMLRVLPVFVHKEQLLRALIEDTNKVLHSLHYSIWYRYPLPCMVPFFALHAADAVLNHPVGRVVWRKRGYAHQDGTLWRVSGAAIELIWMKTDTELKYRISWGQAKICCASRVGDDQTGYVYVAFYKRARDVEQIQRILENEEVTATQGTH